MPEYIIDTGRIPMNRRSEEVEEAMQEMIVRCRDCIKYATNDCPRMALKNMHDRARIAANPFTTVNLCVWHPHGFCAWGEMGDS